jgi:hypothetical protein
LKAVVSKALRKRHTEAGTRIQSTVNERLASNSASNELILAFLVLVVGGPLEEALHSRLSQLDDD